MKIRKYVQLSSPRFIECDINHLLQSVDSVKFTGFYIPNSDANSYFFKSGNDYFLVKTSNFESIKKILINRKREKMTNSNYTIKSDSIDHCDFEINDLMNLFKYNNDIKVEDYFQMCGSGSGLNGCKYEDFLNLIKHVIQIERDMIAREIDMDDKYAIIKYIYDKYKMIASYWNPKENYNTYSAIGLLVADKNRVVQHPYDSLGLINENYATCEGMARSLVELYKYFGINAELARSSIHGVCKVNIIDDDGNDKVTYIDLSKEVTNDTFMDNKYEYRNGMPIRRTTPIRFARPNSYNYFMKALAGQTMNGYSPSNAVDFQPHQYTDYISPERQIILKRKSNEQTSKTDIVLRHDSEHHPSKNITLVHKNKANSKTRHLMVFNNVDVENIHNRHGK